MTAPDLPVIKITTDLHAVTEEAIAALGNDPTLYQRDKELVHVVRAEVPTVDSGVRMPAGSATISTAAPAFVRERLSARAKWAKWSQRSEAGKWIASQPPFDVVATVMARRQWPRKIRPLSGITEIPIVRHDGSIIHDEGYDETTGYLYLPGSLKIEVPERPTHGDAVLAVAALVDLVRDFPFASDAARATWLSALLTTVARAAIRGPVPAFIFDASTPGSGKSLLVEVISLLVLGRSAPIVAQARDNEETEKRLLAVLTSGVQIANVDNVHRAIDDAAFCAALTSTVFSGRILGETRMVTADNVTTWIITGNNVSVSDEMARRALLSRLSPELENPAQRDPTSFRYHPLREHVLANRAKYVAAALTILRAYSVAGYPKVATVPLGSFEAWSNIVAAPLVWLGCADPTQTSRELAAHADPKGDDRASLVRHLSAFLSTQQLTEGITAAGLIRAIYPKNRPPRADDEHDGNQDLRDAVEALVTARQALIPTPAGLGYALRALDGRWIGGLKISSRKGHAKQTFWAVSQPKTA